MGDSSSDSDDPFEALRDAVVGLDADEESSEDEQQPVKPNNHHAAFAWTSSETAAKPPPLALPFYKAVPRSADSPIRLLFLDVDGVLNTTASEVYDLSLPCPALSLSFF